MTAEVSSSSICSIGSTVVAGVRVRPEVRIPLDRLEVATDTVTTVHTGLTGFDVETGSCDVRPELLRLAKRGNQRTANREFALAA